MKLQLFENWQAAKTLATKLNKSKEELDKLKQYIVGSSNQTQGQTKLSSYAGQAAVWYWDENIEGESISSIVGRLFSLGIGRTGVNGLTFKQVTKLVTDLEKRAELEKQTIPGLIYLGDITDGVDDYHVHKVDEYNAVLKVGSPAWCLKTKSQWVNYKAYGYIYVVSKSNLDLDVPDTYPGDHYVSPNMTWRYGITTNPAGEIVYLQDDDNKDAKGYLNNRYDNINRGIPFLLRNFTKLIKEILLKELGTDIRWTGLHYNYIAKYDGKTVTITDNFDFSLTTSEVKPIIYKWKRTDDNATIERTVTCITSDLQRVKNWFKLAEINFTVESSETLPVKPTHKREDKSVKYDIIMQDPILETGENNGMQPDLLVQIVDSGSIILDLNTELELDVDIWGKSILNTALKEINKLNNKECLVTFTKFDKYVAVVFLTKTKETLFLLFKNKDEIFLEDYTGNVLSEEKEGIKKTLDSTTNVYKQITSIDSTMFDTIWDIAIESAEAGYMIE